MGVTRKILNWYARLSPGRGHATAPYEHVVQIGDPTLRKISEPVPQDAITSNAVQTVIKTLRYVLSTYGSVGMSAPQIGVNMRIFAMQHTAKQLSKVSKETIAAMGMTVVPCTVFINPKLKVIDYQKALLPEGCESVRGFTAVVPRFRAVEISGFNEQGEPTTKTFKDWAARIAQHEMDHLDGKLYTDIMDRKSLECTCWEEVNMSEGKLAIPFSPE